MNVKRVPKEPAAMVSFIQDLLEQREHLMNLLAKYGRHTEACPYYHTDLCRCGFSREMRVLRIKEDA